MAPSILDRMQQPAWLLDGNAGMLLANAAARAAVRVRRELVQDGEGLKLRHASQHTAPLEA